MKHLTSISRTCTLALAVLCAGEAAAQHKTGLEFQFDLRYTQGQEDSTIEGDKTSLKFAQRRARWWMSGKQDAFKYKFRFKFKNSLQLSYVKVGLKLGPKTTLTLGRGYDPVDTGTTTYNFRMSDQVIYSGLPIDKGDVGIQLEHKPAGGKLIVGASNGKQTKWSGGVDGSTQLDSFLYGFDYKINTKGVFRPRIGASMHHIPAEKVIATGNQYHGRNDVTLILGTSLVMGDTAVHLSAAQHTKSKAEETLAGGPKTVASEEYKGRAYELRIAQKFSAAFDGSFHIIQNEFRKGGKKDGEATRASAQLFMYPYKHKNAYFTLSLIHDTKKPVGGERSTKNSVFLTASARPSYLIAQ